MTKNTDIRNNEANGTQDVCVGVKLKTGKNFIGANLMTWKLGVSMHQKLSTYFRRLTEKVFREFSLLVLTFLLIGL